MEESTFNKLFTCYAGLTSCRNFQYGLNNKIEFERYTCTGWRPVTGHYKIKVNTKGAHVYSAEFKSDNRVFKTRKAYTEMSLVDAIIKDVIDHIY